MNIDEFATLAGLVVANIPREMPSAWARHLNGNPSLVGQKIARMLLVPEFSLQLPPLARQWPGKWPKFNFDGAGVKDISPESMVVMKLHFAKRGDINHRFLGLQHAIWLEREQDENPALLMLSEGIEIQFPGTTAQDANGRQYMPALVTERYSPRQYEQGFSWKVDWVPAEKFGRGEAYVAIAE